MPSSTFRFKQFVIEQDRCAMKVSTDGILLGAWADGNHAKTALDIGSGTGILSLMLAQRFPELLIETIEIDMEAFSQAKDNIGATRWKSRIKIFHTSLQHFIPKQEFDLIICNPPYFESGVTAQDLSRANARHQKRLTFDELLVFAKTHLTESGKLSVIVPFSQKQTLLSRATEIGLFSSRQTEVRYTPSKKTSRLLVELSQQKVKVSPQHILDIQIGQSNQYSEEFVQMTREFYEFMD